MGKSEKKKVYEIWEVMEKFGLYQILQYLYICVPTIFYTIANINYVFVVTEVNYRCRIPDCEDATTTFEVPWWPNGTDRCLKPVLNTSYLGHQSSCSREQFTNRTESCTEWVYETEDSVISELGLACELWAINSVGTIHNLGMLVAMIIFGYLADLYGRKPIFILCLVITFVGFFKLYAKSYYVFIVIEFLESILGGGAYSSSMLLMIEITGTKSRLLSGIILAYSVYLGETVLAVLAIFFPNWRTLVKIIYIPSILWVGLAYLVHESPRWLVLNGKTKEALETLERIGRTNKMAVNKQGFESIDDKKLKQMFSIANYEKREGLREVFKSKEILKRLLVASVSRFTSNFVYYGLMLNSVWLPGDKYVNFLLSTIMSFPGELISLYLMNKIGRKLPLIVGFIICGVMCIVSAFVPDDMVWAKVTLFLASKVVVAACFTGAITYSMELFPTSARGSLLGISAFAARTGGMLAPLTPILNHTSEALPALCFGASAVITGLLTTLVPETKHMPLTDTIEQAEAYTKPKTGKHGTDQQTGQRQNLGFTGDDAL